MFLLKHNTKTCYRRSAHHHALVFKTVRINNTTVSLRQTAVQFDKRRIRAGSLRINSTLA